jgi:hypothetical protein
VSFLVRDVPAFNRLHDEGRPMLGRPHNVYAGPQFVSAFHDLSEILVRCNGFTRRVIAAV